MRRLITAPPAQQHVEVDAAVDEGHQAGNRPHQRRCSAGRAGRRPVGLQISDIKGNAADYRSMTRRFPAVSYLIGPGPIDLHFWPGAVVMVLVATLTATLVTNGGQSALWFVGVLAMMVYMIDVQRPSAR